MNFSPAFRYQFKEYLKSSSVFYAVNVCIVVVSFLVCFLTDSGSMSYSGYGIACAICLFVFGIVVPRQYLRLCLQLGVSRRTAFLSGLAAALANSALLAAAGELLFGIAGWASLTNEHLYFADLYQIAYLDPGHLLTLTAGQHLISLLFNLFLMFCWFSIGLFLTFLFWRLNKAWTIVVAILIPVLLGVLPTWSVHLSLAFSAFARAMAALGGWLSASPWNVMLLCILISAFFCSVGWLLVRRVNIRAPSSH